MSKTRGRYINHVAVIPAKNDGDTGGIKKTTKFV